MAAPTEQELVEFGEDLLAQGFTGRQIMQITSLVRTQGSLTDPLVVQLIDSLRPAAEEAEAERLESEQAEILQNRQDAAGGPEQLAALERAFEFNLPSDSAAQFGEQFAPVFEDLGAGQDAVDFIRGSLVLGEPNQELIDDFFPLGDPAQQFDPNIIREQLGLPPVEDIPEEVVSQNASDEIKAALADLGLGYRGENPSGNIIAVAPNGEEFIYGLNDDGSIFRIGKAGATGIGGGGAGGAAVRLQSIGVDKDGFALVFNPATGSVTRGPQVGFGAIDPRIIAAEEARQFNEGQALREGEFLRDVLSNGRNFLTAALLSRGGREGFTTGLTQADILRAGGVAAFDGQQQSLGGLNQSLGFLSPEDQQKVPGFVIEGLEEQGALDPGAAAGFAPAGDGTPAAGQGPGLVRPGEVDPTTLARPAGATFGQTSRFAVGDKPRTGTTADSNLATAGSLGAQALAFAPPAVKDIAAGKEVGSLSTPGGGFAIPLANPQTLANLSPGERGALDTTLQNVDQRTLAEFEQESIQRFRGQGSRTATRSR